MADQSQVKSLAPMLSKTLEESANQLKSEENLDIAEKAVVNGIGNLLTPEDLHKAFVDGSTLGGLLSNIVNEIDKKLSMSEKIEEESLNAVNNKVELAFGANIGAMNIVDLLDIPESKEAGPELSKLEGIDNVIQALKKYQFNQEIDNEDKPQQNQEKASGRSR